MEELKISFEDIVIIPSDEEIYAALEMWDNIME